MGLFINKEKHLKVYKNTQEIKTSNQEFVRYNFLTELIIEQQKANKELTQSISDLKRRYEKHGEEQSVQWNHVKKEMQANHRNRVEFENQLIQQIHTLDEKTHYLQEVLEKESILKQSIMEQIHSLGESSQEIVSRIEKSEATSQLLKAKMNQQFTLQKEVAETLSNTKEFQTGVIERLDNQEAITEKILRQINHIRSILFERTNYLATKINEGYKMTSSYVYKLMTGSDHPLTFSLMNYKKEEEKQK